MTLISSTLDNLIAFVIVLLALSLVVQAIQGFIKKVFKLKSRQIEKSLLQLFEDAIDDTNAKRTATELFDQTISTFKSLGRFTLWNNPIFDSVSKGDLLHVVGKVQTAGMGGTVRSSLEVLSIAGAEVSVSASPVHTSISSLLSNSNIQLTDAETSALVAIDELISRTAFSLPAKLTDINSTNIEGLTRLVQDPLFIEVSGLLSTVPGLIIT